jgi:hypothetical protein
VAGVLTQRKQTEIDIFFAVLIETVITLEAPFFARSEFLNFFLFQKFLVFFSHLPSPCGYLLRKRDQLHIIVLKMRKVLAFGLKA